MRRAVFYDRDGVVNPLVGRKRNASDNVPRITSPWTMNEFEVFDGVEESVSAIKRKGYLALVATNQPGLAYGEVSAADYAEMCAVLTRLGFDGIYTCEHPLDSTCECRKPKPGLLLQAARERGVSLADSYFVGDSESDMIAAARANCIGVLLRRTYNAGVRAPIKLSRLDQLPSIMRS